MHGVRETKAIGAEVAPSAENAVRSELTANYALYERLARYRADSRSEADDIVQSFALKALRRAGQLQDPCAVRGWLRRVFETSVIDHFRSRSKIRQRNVPFEDTNGAAELEFSSSEPFEEMAMLQETMAQLKSEYAEIICHVDLKGQTSGKIADALGITINNLAVRVHRARAAFRAALGRRAIARRAPNLLPHCSAHAVCHQTQCPLENGGGPNHGL